MKSVKLLLLFCIVITILPSCAFTNWNDQAFVGAYYTEDERPRYPNRYITGYFLAPFAAAGDIITAPVQFGVLVVAGDRALYAPFERRKKKTDAKKKKAKKRVEREKSPATQPSGGGYYGSRY